ncbi:hypothetical protein A3B84_01440 [Candidatus Nomurabacteria bacterium RIFCSPHIGHO2_02_FULL_35_13]|uniref:Uncharacterized protein n=1 Tax=Candidatus Nomurabacteria bacterium RIFCSPHIGHO2_02_FULL_35_13 TaxID=1801748 RepID=A0A1F6VNG3_9BACT|nr:MAG: hypothetical protein A3B84_01440 [Candidatus Nomurabacteria bacterium RIFCSPHIGHO2_02_FULL_35_13]
MSIIEGPPVVPPTGVLPEVLPKIGENHHVGLRHEGKDVQGFISAVAGNKCLVTVVTGTGPIEVEKYLTQVHPMPPTP